MSKKIPISIICGYLGSGKTTLLKYIMQADHGKKIAVIQNEVSEEMGIESPTIVDSNGDLCTDIYELPNGCICCSVRNDIVTALETLVNNHRDKFDFILVETTGIANMETVIQSFWLDSGLDSLTQLCGVLCLVDCANFLDCISEGTQETPEGTTVDFKRQQFEGIDLGVLKGYVHEEKSFGLMGFGREALKQVAVADVLVLNKMDRVESKEKLERLENVLREINPFAVLHHTERSVIPLDLIFSVDSYNKSAVKGDVENAFLSLKREKELESQEEGCGEKEGVCVQNGGSCDHYKGESGFCEHHKGESGSCEGHKGDKCGKKSGCTVESHESGRDGISTVFLSYGKETVFDVKRLERSFAEKLWNEEIGFVYRYKGIFNGKKGTVEEEEVEGEGESEDVVKVVAFQGVGDVYEFTIVPHCEILNENKFLFVGRGINKDVCESIVTSAIVD